ncbi:hypothetical protein HX112_03245 [Acinetobacter towneri]|uniref:hypothetical protein n=1 Tax=Acinetobacter towneri TaxID=202956 RepID=UPI0025757174|nr:hypothetical protein [Acinetobacter towneri]MDM1735589.1 hypothetical protein [Acinetobacter towneri]
MSGLENTPSAQSCECKNCCSSLVHQMLETINNQNQQITALINSHAEQNKVLAQIVDQNNDLIAELIQDDEEIGSSSSGYLDG